MNTLLLAPVFPTGPLSNGMEALSLPVGVVLAAALLVTVLILVWLADRKRQAPRPRHRGIDTYRRFLAEHDGEPDLLRHTLSARERTLAELAARPPRSSFQPDHDQFQINLRRGRPEPGLDPRMLWLLATAKANQAERFAVGLAEVYGRMQIGVDERVLLHIHLQETYHTRLLAEVVSIFGLTVSPRPPARAIRLFINCLVFTPPEWMLPLTGASEMVGCVLFRAMRDLGCALFRNEPEVADRIRALYDQILADEIGHVGYIAARLGPMRRRLMRRIYLWIGPRMVAQMPELGRLYPQTEWRQRLGAFDLEEMVTECHGLAYAAAIP